jgi:beta-alanine degradation protein BauB
MTRFAAAIGAGVLSTAAQASDPVHTDGDKYKVKFENEQVRVLEYRDKPGERTHEHTHPNFVLYTVSSFKRRISLPDGKSIIREFKGGEIMWSGAQTHIGENVGDTPTHVIIIELK